MIKANRSLNSRGLETCTKLLTHLKMGPTVRARTSTAYMVLKMYAATVYMWVGSKCQPE